MYGCVVIVSASLLSACADKKETKNSSDFATSAIEANFSVEVSEAHKVIYRANFFHDNNSLKLEGGDAITITAIASEKIALNEFVSGGIATYSLIRTETSDPSGTRPFFDFTRSSQTDSRGSVVPIPKGFVLSSPTAISSSYVPSGGKQFTITWRDTDSSKPTPDDNEEFKLRYDFSCRGDNGSPSTAKGFEETTLDDGEHVVNLATVLGAGAYDSCSAFNIIATRSDKKSGSLNRELGKGSTVGSQVRTIKGSLDGLHLQ